MSCSSPDQLLKCELVSEYAGDRLLSKPFAMNVSWKVYSGVAGQKRYPSLGSGELSAVCMAVRGIMSGLDPKSPRELAGDPSRMMVPSGFLFLRGLPSLLMLAVETHSS